MMENRDRTLEVKKETPESIASFPQDHNYAQRLISGETVAWDSFYKEYRKKIETFIERKYVSVFGSVAVEEIYDGVIKRLISNDYKALRSYRGECSFSSYLTRATDWEIKDWLRRHSDELFHESIDAIGDDPTCGHRVEPQAPSVTHQEKEIPQPVSALNNDLRWAFLLRYYDLFGFPLAEIRLVAKTKGLPISQVTQKIINFLEPEGKDVLAVQKAKQRATQERLQKLTASIHEVNVREQQLSGREDHGATVPQDTKIDEKIGVVRDRLSRLKEKKAALENKNTKDVVTTPYEVIAEILGEDNVSTIRSRVFLAKQQLRNELLKGRNS